MTVRPDWVMLGVPRDDGVAILASKTLTHAELEVEYHWARHDGGHGFWEVDPKQDPDKTVTFTAVGTSVVVAYGTDYAAALASLLASWRPDSASAALSAPLPAIEGT